MKENKVAIIIVVRATKRNVGREIECRSGKEENSVENQDYLSVRVGGER